MDYKKKVPEKFEKIKDMSEKEALREIRKLREAINYHNYLYYEKGKPVISDAAYDKLFKRLRKLEDEFPRYESDTSPTKNVGHKPSGKLKKIKHSSPMLSLNAGLEEKEIKGFYDYIEKNTGKKENEYSLEPKFDGFSVEIVYKNGKFIRGTTRGDGETGEDITHNLKMIKSIPRVLNGKEKNAGYLAVRGEVFMSKKGFQKMNRDRLEDGKEAFANPRNAASGIMRQLDPGMVEGKPLDIFFYEMLKLTGLKINSHFEALDMLKKAGLKTCKSNKKAERFDEIKKYRAEMEEKRDALDYEIDGITVKLSGYKGRKKLGTRQRSPRWAFAWKFPPREETTQLEEIAVQVGRTGMLTPVALLQPVDVGGVTVSRATLHNEDEVKKKDLRPGDKVKLERAGDVIPEITKRIGGHKKNAEKFSMPDKCPSCNSKVTKEGAYYFCSAGLSCRAQLTGRIIHFCSRDAMNIEGLGTRIAGQMVEKKMIKDIAGIYALKQKDFLNIEGFASKAAETLYNAVQESKNRRADRFLFALGIRHVGLHIAGVIMRKYGVVEKLFDIKKNEFNSIDEIGPETAQSISDFFKKEKNKKSIKKMKKYGVSPEKIKVSPAKKKFKGETFVFTGELEDFTRSEAKRTVGDLGGRAASSVSSETDYLVKGESPGSKLNKAKKHNVRIIDEKGFKKLIKKGG